LPWVPDKKNRNTFSTFFFPAGNEIVSDWVYYRGEERFWENDDPMVSRHTD